ncbi:MULTISPECIES: winged helix-turn-helix domain-containing tetratricopeptide repeat protein [unclassified Mesorhizobium]|uniref:winged helix-turn-helix domain-containing tetratricopeptide repeat protein n=1 Tax=unclassified Mesorhizobium TaxID=325217 RepID=UPI00112A5BE3|nr:MULTISPECIES: winged helix-turn-helix domain-containing protein [unclassified Mesorhizobium]MBZ9810440.1 winged helix-turn-helix domain-containing protein [Mesorhizobium sp. ESP-6-2]TPM25455.1 tetratricopeptide repeat protein [Mesorhizobium sp. B2-2-2]
MVSLRFAFGPFVLDAGSSALFEHSLPVAIGSKSLALLKALVEARGQVVRKAALMDAAWPNTNVEESNLTVQIAALRRRLRISPDGEEWIATFPRVGYRFAGPLTVAEREAPVVDAGLPLEANPSLAVLPFAYMSADPEQAHFADGLVDDLITDLSKVPGLLVTASHSSFALKARFTDTQSIAKELGVQYIVEGSVRRVAGQVRIGARLTEATMNRCLWAERFDGDLADLFHLQDQVVRRVVAALVNVLPLGPVLDGPRRRMTIEAYDFLVRGRVLVMHSPAGNDLARILLSKAAELDPNLAEAYAWLAVSHYNAAIQYGEDFNTNQALGLAYAQKAMSIDVSDPMAHSVLGFVRLCEGMLEEAESALQTALRINPNHADTMVNMAGLRVLQGRPHDAVELAENALRLNPYPPGWYYWDLGFAYYAAGDYTQAVRVLRKEEVGRLPAKRILAASLAQLGQLTQAQEEAQRFLEINPGFRASRWATTQSFRRDEDRQHFVDGYVKAGLPL